MFHIIHKMCIESDNSRKIFSMIKFKKISEKPEIFIFENDPIWKVKTTKSRPTQHQKNVQQKKFPQTSQ